MLCAYVVYSASPCLKSKKLQNLITPQRWTSNVLISQIYTVSVSVIILKFIGQEIGKLTQGRRKDGLFWSKPKHCACICTAICRQWNGFAPCPVSSESVFNQSHKLDWTFNQVPPVFIIRNEDKVMWNTVFFLMTPKHGTCQSQISCWVYSLP